MQASSFIDISSWIIQNADRNMLDNRRIACELTSNFWPATKVRQMRWDAKIVNLASAIQAREPNDPAAEIWDQLVVLCDEVVLSEVLSRVWFAVIITKTNDQDVIDVAQCIIPDHIKTRKQAMGLWNFAPESAAQLRERTKLAMAIRDQANDLMLSQISQEVVGRNLSISFETFDKFFACRCEYAPQVLMKANRVLAKSYCTDVARLCPQPCENSDINMQTIVSICNSFDDDEIELPGIVAGTLAG